jgi:hypothetical protein
MVKVSFLNGAKLEDVEGVFNAELEGNQWRAIKIFQGDKVNASGLRKLLLAAVVLNADKGKAKAKPATARRPAKAKAKTTKGTRTAAKAKTATHQAARSKRQRTSPGAQRSLRA